MRRTPDATAPSFTTLKSPISAGGVEVRPAAQLGREVPDADHPDAVAVLLAEERHGAALERVLQIHLGRAHDDIGLHLLVDELFHLLDLAVLQAGAVREIEAQMVGRHERAGLPDVGAEHPAQRRVQEVRAGVVLAQPLAAARLDAHRDLVALREHALA